MMRKSAILVTLITAVTLTAQTQPPARPARNAAEMEPMLAKIATYEVGQNPEVLDLFTEYVQESMGSPALLKQIEARLLRFVQSDATAAGKQFAFQDLSLVATDASIPVLTPLLVRTETSQMARYALERIPGPAADEALRKSLDKATGTVKIGIVNSLGRRRDAKSVPVLGALISSSDPGMAEAASAALAKIGDQPALDALAAARSKAVGPLREVVSEAYVECADQFAARGEKVVAAKVYRQLIAPQEPQMVRIRAMGGLAAAEGKNAVPVLSAAIQSTDPKVQAAAIRSLSGIPGPEVTNVLVKEFPKLQPSAQVRVVAALANRGDASARQLIMTAAKGNAGVVRTAALAGLGKLGDASSVMVLAEAAAASQGLEQNAARQSLYGLRGRGIDPAIVAAIGSSSGKVKAELISAAGDRGVASAADALAKAVQETDPDVHREAVRALRNVAGPAQVPALLELLLKASTSSDRRDATQTLAAAINRSRPVPIGTVISAYKSAPTPEARLSLLEIMGLTSHPEALPLLRSGLNDPDRDVARAAILALSGWTTAAPLTDLLTYAKSGGDPTLQILALRGYLKLVTLPSPRPAPESARLLGEAMRLSSQTAEKRNVLSLLATYPCKESLQLAEASLRDTAVASEAKVAVDQINDSMAAK